MEKLFINTMIFNNESDYQIGGFFTEKKEITYSDVKYKLEERIRQMLYSYVEEQEIHQKTSGKEFVNTPNQLLQQLVDDYLDLDLDCDDVEYILQQIMSSDKINAWLLKVRDRFENDNKKVRPKPILTDGDKGVLELQEIEGFVKETELRSLLETIHMIF